MLPKEFCARLAQGFIKGIVLEERSDWDIEMEEWEATRLEIAGVLINQCMSCSLPGMGRIGGFSRNLGANHFVTNLVEIQISTYVFSHTHFHLLDSKVTVSSLMTHSLYTQFTYT